VLGNIAELNLARAMAISDDLTLFVTRPWALFFLIIALFSAIFPWFQKARGKQQWTLFYLPITCFAVCVPVGMMAWQHGSLPRGVIAIIVLVSGAAVLWRRWQSGWDLAAFKGDHELREG